MNVLFEDDGAFKAATVLEAPGSADAASYHVELPTGRRLKIKTKDVVLVFDQPAAGSVIEEAEVLAQTIDVPFLWEVAPQDEFQTDALGAEYFGARPTAVQSIALLLRLQSAPIYFRRKGKGRYKPAPLAEVQAALAGLERKKLAAEQQALIATELAEGRLPPAWSERGSAGLSRAAWVFLKPDKNTVEWKALDQATRIAHVSPERLLLRAGAFDDAYALHRARFIAEWFPKGLDASVATPTVKLGNDLTLADVQAFSIDDSQTTEIDDAFSVQRLSEQHVRVGVHIAAPALSIAPGDAIDEVARKRMSTVYMPGEKITMLPDAIIETFTLAEGSARPALSLYAEFDLESGECSSVQTRIERIHVAANLRHDQLDEIVTEASLADETTHFPFKAELGVLWRLAQRLSAKRDEARGKPEPRNRTDYQFRIDRSGGQERVVIDQRKRDAPLDRLVAEWMIFTNSAWGQRLADAGVPGIYRVQTQWARPGSKQSAVRMTTAAERHLGLGVSSYAWSSSPLRRYVDLVNQWQLVSLLRLQRPPFEKNSAELFGVIGAFEAAYAAYADVQNRMERYWCLRWLAQEHRIGSGQAMTATVLRDERVRFSDLPLVAPLAGIGHVPVGASVDVEVLAVDDVDLSIELRLSAVHAPVEREQSPGDAAEGEIDDDVTMESEPAVGFSADSSPPSVQESTPAAPPEG